MEIAVDLEDDLFFADISKQISLLIMDEDDEDPVAVCSSVSIQQALSRVNYQAAPSPYLYEQSCRTRESKGTGVFIPRSLQPRRKHHHHRQGSFSSFNTKSHSQYRQQHENTRMVSQSSCNNGAYNSKRSYREQHLSRVNQAITRHINTNQESL